MVYTLRFFSSKCSLFHNYNLFGSCIIHILYTECAEIKKKIIPAPKGSNQWSCAVGWVGHFAVKQSNMFEPENEGTTIFRNVGNYSSNDKVSHLRICESTSIFPPTHMCLRVCVFVWGCVCMCVCVCIYVCVCVWVCVYMRVFFLIYLFIQHAPLQSNTTCFCVSFLQYSYLYTYVHSFIFYSYGYWIITLWSL